MNPRPNEYAYFLPIVMPLVQPCPKYLVTPSGTRRWISSPGPACGGNGMSAR